MVGLDDSVYSSSNFSLNGTSTLQHTHEGATFGPVLDDVETYQNTTGAQFRIGPSSSMTYVAMNAGDTYGFTGSVTYDLTGGMTAAAFTNGSFSNAINGGDFVWSVAVPETSNYAILLGGFSILFILARRIRSTRQFKRAA